MDANFGTLFPASVTKRLRSISINHSCRQLGLRERRKASAEVLLVAGPRKIH
jgi:hypothetical protein